MHGAVRSTVTSIHEGRIAGKLAALADESGSPAVTLVDFPGAGQMRGEAMTAAGACAGVVFVVDAAAPYDAASAHNNHWKAAADQLYELLTAPGVADADIPLLLLCNKTDAAGARNCDAVRAILEGELYVARHLYHLPMSAAYVPTHSRTQPQPLQ